MSATRNEFYVKLAFHPGETLEEKLTEMDMKPEELAEKAHLPVKTVKQIIAGKLSVSREYAEALESVLKIPVHFWLNMQKGYDEFHKEKSSTVSSSVRPAGRLSATGGSTAPMLAKHR